VRRTVDLEIVDRNGVSDIASVELLDDLKVG
jgi:hypothetical protein